MSGLMRSILVTGASRGLGLEFVRQLAGQGRPPDHVVFASCRNPSQATELKELEASNPCVKVLELDVQNEDTYGPAVKLVEDIVRDQGLNVIINNAGINRGATARYSKLNRQQMAEVFDVNAIAPARVTEAFLPLVLRAADMSPLKSPSFERAAICNISSSLGSISRNNSAGFPVFRESKAALNMLTKSLSVELKRDNILVVSMCPGWVRTDSGGPFAVQSPTEAVEKILTNLQNATMEFSGKLIGNTIPPTFYDF